MITNTTLERLSIRMRMITFSTHSCKWVTPEKKKCRIQFEKIDFQLEFRLRGGGVCGGSSRFSIESYIFSFPGSPNNAQSLWKLKIDWNSVRK